MKHRWRVRSRYVIAAAVAAALFCSHEYNPFSDYSNAGICIIRQSVNNVDTIDVFSTETLSVIVLVKELVDSFAIHFDHNRLWSRGDSVIYKKDFGAEPFTFLFSLYDTGQNVVRICAFKSNGLHDTTLFAFSVRSPLHQTAVVARFGDYVLLSTPAVKDRDVNYYWSFGAGSRFSSPACSTVVALSMMQLTGKGALWVSDGAHASCADTFTFAVRDTSLPVIVCMNAGFVGKDTVMTGDSVFNFKVRITTGGDYWVDSASIDGKSFDRKDNKVYYSLIDNMYLHDTTSPLVVDVFALSHFTNGIPIERPFTLIFSKNVAPTLPAEIRVLSPSGDSMFTILDHYTISGVVESHSVDSLNLLLSVYVNGSPGPLIKRITGNVSCAWDFNIGLAPGPNSISLTAKDFVTASTVHQISFTLMRADSVRDSTCPRILAVTANGLPADNYYIDKSSMLIGVKAFDEISGIDTLTINGRKREPSGSDIWYYDSIALYHIQSGNEVLIRARDRKNNDTSISVIIFRNRLPVVQQLPVSSIIAIDSFYVDTIEAFDPDNDSIVYEKAVGPEGISIDAQGVLSWRPTSRDTGHHTITLRIWDGYQPLFYSYTLYVFGDYGHPGPVRFTATTNIFPSYLEAGKDTLVKVLNVVPATGIRPFLFFTRITNKSKVILPEGPDSVLRWAPSLSDTGYMQLMVGVRDAFPSSDTIYPRILIIPGNRPCSLSVSFSGTTTATGALDLNRKREKDTLIFRINDPDNQFIERHDVSIYETRARIRSLIDSAVVDSFSMVLDPLAFDGYDTIIATVRDRSYITDTLKVTAYFGAPPSVPQYLNPVDLQSIAGNNVLLSWQGSDPDGDDLTFDVFFGQRPDSLATVAITAASSAAITGLVSKRTYYWRIVARDWKSTTEGPIWQFSTQ